MTPGVPVEITRETLVHMFDEERAWLLNLAERVVGPNQAEDAVQNAFLSLFRCNMGRTITRAMLGRRVKSRALHMLQGRMPLPMSDKPVEEWRDIRGVAPSPETLAIAREALDRLPDDILVIGNKRVMGIMLTSAEQKRLTRFRMSRAARKVRV